MLFLSLVVGHFRVWCFPLHSKSSLSLSNGGAERRNDGGGAHGFDEDHEKKLKRMKIRAIWSYLLFQIGSHPNQRILLVNSNI